MKYLIIPVNDIVTEIEADSKDDAMGDFAWDMESDMNLYFRAVTEEEYAKIKREAEYENRKKVQIDFYIDELRDNFDVPEEAIEDVAENAYEIYCNAGRADYCDIESEYDALERAYDEWLEEEQ